MSTLAIQSVPKDSPWRWLAEGWRDMMRAPVLSIGYGAVFVGLGLLISAGLWRMGLSAWIPAAASGFALIAPLCAIGFYRISRTLDEGGTPTVKTLFDMRSGKRTQIAYLAMILLIIFLMWARLAQFIYAYFTIGYYKPLNEFTQFVLTDPAGLTLLIVGTAVGAVLAFAAFAVSVLSFPMIMDKDVDMFTAVAASLKAVKDQPYVMLVWAFLIGLMTLGGAALFIVGLAVVFPWLGHASWRAYKSFDPSPPG